VALLAFCEGRAESFLLDEDLIGNTHLIETITFSRFLLDHFLDVPPDSIPLNRIEKGIFGQRLMKGATLEEVTAAVESYRQARSSRPEEPRQ